MTYAVLEKEVSVLPLELQNNIKSYIQFVINQYKSLTKIESKEEKVSSKIDSLVGILKDSQYSSIEEIRSARLSEKFGI